MKNLILTTLFALFAAQAQAQQMDIILHFEDAIVVNRHCDDIGHMTWVEGERHLGKIAIDKCKQELINYPGWMPDIDEDSFWVMVRLDQRLFMRCAVMNNYFAGGRFEMIVSCRESYLTRQR